MEIELPNLLENFTQIYNNDNNNNNAGNPKNILVLRLMQSRRQLRHTFGPLNKLVLAIGDIFGFFSHVSNRWPVAHAAPAMHFLGLAKA